MSLGAPFALSRRSFVAPAGSDAVLKVAPPEDDESTYEADALELWAGDGAVRLLRHDRSRRAMLLQRARPGTDASRLSEREALHVAVDVSRRLWRPPPTDAPFERIADRVPAWLASVGDGGLAREAKRVYAVLRPGDDVLVHGDLHHHNLLRHDDRWVAIDPKPMRGEREFDVVTLLWNPLGTTPTREHVARVIDAFAAEGLDRERIRAWGIVRGTYLALDEPGDAVNAAQLRVAQMLLDR